MYSGPPRTNHGSFTDKQKAIALRDQIIATGRTAWLEIERGLGVVVYSVA